MSIEAFNRQFIIFILHYSIASQRSKTFPKPMQCKMIKEDNAWVKINEKKRVGHLSVPTPCCVAVAAAQVTEAETLPSPLFDVTCDVLAA